MTALLSRVLLTVASLVLALGGYAHAAAFKKADAIIGASGLPAFHANSCRALWLIDSATLITLAAVFTWIAIRPEAASRWITMLLAVIPTATALLVYNFVGPFFAPHMLIGASAAVLVAGLLPPATRPS